MTNLFSRYLRIIALSAILLLMPVLSHAQLPFRSSVSYQENALSEFGMIEDVVTDANDNIWYATTSGLFRYNGSIYKSFFADEEKSLSSDYIICLYADPDDGSLWAGSDSGIHHLVNSEVVLNDTDPSFGNIVAIDGWDDSSLLLGSSRGILLYDEEKESASVVCDDESVLSPTMLKKCGDYIWIKNSSVDELVILDASFSIVSRVNLEDRKGVNGITPCHGKVYVPTTTGLLCFSQRGESVDLPEKMKDFSGNILFSIYDKGKDALVICSRDRGVVRHYFTTDLDETILPSSDLSSANTVIAAVTKYNVCIVKDHADIVFSRDIRSSYQQVVGLKPSEQIISILSSLNDGCVLLSTTEGLYRLDLNSGELQPIRLSFGSVNLSSMISAFIDSEGYLWMRSNDATINKFVLSSDGYTLTRTYDGPSGMCMPWEDSDGNILSASGNSIYVIHTDGSMGIVNSTQTLSSFCCKDPNGNVYLYGSEGVFRQMSSSPIAFEKIPIDLNPTSMAADKSGHLWIGTEKSGLYRYDLESGNLVNLSVSDGLPDKSVRNIICFRNEIWASFPHNVAKINPSTLEVGTFIEGQSPSKSVNYGMRSGSSLFVKSLGDRIIFGCGKGLTCIDPDNYETDREIPVRIDALVSDGEQVSPETSSLAHDRNSIVFFFSGTDYDFGQSLSYSYKLDGYDKDWLYAGNAHTAMYPRLRAGKYTFRVRVQLPNGHWSEDQAVREFRIRRPFWLSIPMMLLYVLASAGVVIQIMRSYERKRKEAEKAEIAEVEQRMNVQLDREKINFLANISHEYRTPLSLIYGPAKELSRETGLSERGRSLVSTITRNASRMMDLTGELLDYDKAGYSNAGALKVRRTSLVSLVQSVVGNFGYMFENKGLVSATDIDCPDEQVWCDTQKVIKILTNLVSNAVKYTPTGGSVMTGLHTIDSSKALETFGKSIDGYSGPWAVVSVSDTGEGIPAGKVKEIFEKYRRLKNSEKSAEGFGLGLNYAMHLAELHKGLLDVSSNHPTGAIFSLVFPCGKDAYSSEELLSEGLQESETITEKVSGEIPEDSREFTVLVVEDNPDLLDYTRSTLSKYFSVICASDGLEALEILKGSAVNLVLSDVMMPQMDGYVLCQKIKDGEDTGCIPVVLLTAMADAKSQITGYSRSADAYICKPFDPDLLCAQIYSLMANRRRLQKAISDSTASGQLPSDGLSAKDRALLEKMHSLMEENLADESYSAAMMAEQLGISYSKFFYKSKTLLGLNPGEWITAYRLNKAMELLKTGKLNSSEVAFKVGFSSPQSFSRSFKNKFGVSPSSI